MQRLDAGRRVMLGELDEEQIDLVLSSEIIGRLGCIAYGRPYIVPITYVYDGRAIYAQSAEGMKLQAMRENPEVCLEVEQVRSMANWRTVVVRGRFEELLSDEEARALALLATRLHRIETSATARLVQHEDIVRRERLRRPILFRIRVEERTGRFELI
jgi:nitroimidazol reductase NimA-like FMN-containing flavoprotein (pyridoxamine 5'-phosphate oxidase superfamily)